MPHAQRKSPDAWAQGLELVESVKGLSSSLVLLALLVSGMVGGAQRLPVAAIPEKSLIASMWHPVVNHSRRLHPALGLAADAQGVRAQEALASLLPLVAVATLAASLVTGAPAAGLHCWHSPSV